jgi:hypothetical protein
MGGMAFYLIDTGDPGDTRLSNSGLVEADSAKQAVQEYADSDGSFRVWTLRGEPRTYQIETETVTTIKQT